MMHTFIPVSTVGAVATSPTLTRVPAGVVPASAPSMASSPRVYTDRASALQAAEEVRLELTRKMTSMSGGDVVEGPRGGAVSAAGSASVPLPPPQSGGLYDFNSTPPASATYLPSSRTTASVGPLLSPRFVQPPQSAVVTVSGAGGTTSSLGPSASAAGGLIPGSSHSNYEFFQGSKPVPSAEVSSRTTTNNGDDVLQLAGDDAVHDKIGIAGSKEPRTRSR